LRIRSSPEAVDRPVALAAKGMQRSGVFLTQRVFKGEKTHRASDTVANAAEV
jgi:hypothetical protein